MMSAFGVLSASPTLGLGSKADAIREGELAVELLPMSKEAWRGAYREEDLARIYAMVGEYDAAIDQLESLLAVPSPTAVPMLRIDPIWKPLRAAQILHRRPRPDEAIPRRNGTLGISFTKAWTIAIRHASFRPRLPAARAQGPRIN